MKNKAGFKVGDKVLYIKTSTRYDPNCLNEYGIVKYTYDDRCEVKFTKEKGVTKTWCVLNENLTKVKIGICTPPPLTPHEMANDKDNVWAISITPAPFDRERTVASLVINGRVADMVTVSRWHDEDKYDIGVAAYEVIKKMFDIKDKAVEKTNDTTTKEPEWFTGKIVCTCSDSGEFTKGKIYQVNHGVLFNNDFFKYGNFKSVEDINKRLYSQFVEVVE